MIADAGESLFTRARNLEEHLGVRRLFLKFEGSNPSGTQKDRIALAHYLDAHEKGFKIITVATCGNFGASLAWACSANGIRPVVFVPEAYHTRRIDEMERVGARVVRVPGDYESAVAASREAARDNGWYDANPGAHNWHISSVAYGGIAREIVAGLGGRVPDTVACSVGNGTTLAGIYAGFRALRDEGAIDRLPSMIAASTPRGNPIIASFKKGLQQVVDLRPDEVRETEVNEPLTNWHSFDGERALAALRESGGAAVYASDAEMKRLQGLVLEVEGINALTASCAALAGLTKTVAARGSPVGLHVAVLTGRGITKRAAAASAPVAQPVPVSVPEARQ